MSEVDVFDALKYHIEVDRYGTRKYYNNAGELHRLNGPAIERFDGTKYWYQHGLRHRTDGPAIEWCDGDKWWFIDGVHLTAAEFKLAVKNHERTRSI